MTTNHFRLIGPVPSKPSHDPRPLRLDGHAGAATEAKRPFRFAPISIGLHAALILGVMVGPLFFEGPSPEPASGVRAFFAEPSLLVTPPPPPPPRALAPRTPARKASIPAPDTKTLVAPTEVSDRIAPPSMSLGDTSGTPGGVEGGVEGGVAGGIVGGLLTEPPPPPKKPNVIRVGGDIRAPKRLVYVPPIYPAIAAQAAITGVVILEAHVGTDGRVKESTVLRGQPLFDEAAQTAVAQWRYQPLLLNGIPMEFILTVTVKFNLKSPE